MYIAGDSVMPVTVMSSDLLQLICGSCEATLTIWSVRIQLSRPSGSLSCLVAEPNLTSDRPTCNVAMTLLMLIGFTGFIFSLCFHGK